MNDYRTLVAATALLALGCTSHGMRFDDVGFARNVKLNNRDAEYRVRYAAGTKEIISQSWRINNFKQPITEMPPRLKENAEYELWLDLSGDGNTTSIGDYPLYDLELIHKEHDGRIYLRTIPLGYGQSTKALDVLMDRYIGSLAASGSVTTLGALVRAAVGPRYVAEIVASGKTQLNGLDAFEATVYLADTDVIKLDPAARQQRMRIVMARPKWKVYYGSRMIPVVVVAAYTNRIERFADSEADFKTFLGSLELKVR